MMIFGLLCSNQFVFPNCPSPIFIMRIAHTTVRKDGTRKEVGEQDEFVVGVEVFFVFRCVKYSVSQPKHQIPSRHRPLPTQNILLGIQSATPNPFILST